MQVAVTLYAERKGAAYDVAVAAQGHLRYHGGASMQEALASGLAGGNCTKVETCIALPASNCWCHVTIQLRFGMRKGDVQFVLV